MVTRRPIHEPSQLAGRVPSGSQPAAACTSGEALRHVAEMLDRRRPERRLKGAATDAAPQPPAPNTNLVLSVPELLPPFRKIEIGDGWSSSGTESNKEKGQAVGGERRSRNTRKDDSKDAK